MCFSFSCDILKDCTTTVIAKKNILGGEIPHMNQLSQLMTTTLTTTDAPTCITPENTAPLTEMIPTAPRTIRMQPPSLRTKESLLFDCPSLSPLTPRYAKLKMEFKLYDCFEVNANNVVFCYFSSLYYANHSYLENVSANQYIITWSNSCLL